MTPLVLILCGLCVIALSGLPACFFSRTSAAAQRVTVVLMAGGSLAGLVGTFGSFSAVVPVSISMPWALPFGRFLVSADPLSAFFLVPVFIVPALGSLYGLEYWKQADHPENGRKLGLFFGLLTAGMALVLISRDAVLFLMAWETMALAAFFVLTTEDDRSDVREVGWVYLLATHAGTLVLFLLFVYWYSVTGSFDLAGTGRLAAGSASLVFMLAVMGFGFKAGIMPLHVWLPGAHANAPCHVSAVMSGVLLKTGVYGILRMTGLCVPSGPWWGTLLLVAGGLSAVFGIAFALGQRDLKRVLAYSSIENIGVIFIGTGLALLGRSYGRADLILLGLGGALLHVWNHSLFKPLLFFNSGAVVHASGTRDIEAMGALAKKMPRTAFLFFIGAAAVVALPPLNGFAGEWLMYLGLFRTLDSSAGSLLPLAGAASALLAMSGALALAVFVKAYGTVFLGSSRSVPTGHERDAGPAMTVPMTLLAAACVVLGLFPQIAMPAVLRAVSAWAPSDSRVQVAAVLDLQAVAPQNRLSVMGVFLLLLALAIFLAVKISGRKKTMTAGPTWDCGYAAPSARMQYTGTSLGQTVVDLFSFALKPERLLRDERKLFPETEAFEVSVPDRVLDGMILPAFEKINLFMKRIYVFQQGQTHLYVLYIFVTAIFLFLFAWLTGGAL